MQTQEQTQLITILRSLIDLTESEATQAVGLFQTQSLSRSDFFIRAGDTPQTIGFVISGILRLYYVDSDGTTIRLHTIEVANFIQKVITRVKRVVLLLRLILLAVVWK